MTQRIAPSGRVKRPHKNLSRAIS